MRCPKCNSKRTEIRSETKMVKSGFNFHDETQYDIWRCRECGELWKKGINLSDIPNNDRILKLMKERGIGKEEYQPLRVKEFHPPSRAYKMPAKKH